MCLLPPLPFDQRRRTQRSAWAWSRGSVSASDDTSSAALVHVSLMEPNEPRRRRLRWRAALDKRHPEPCAGHLFTKRWEGRIRSRSKPTSHPQRPTNAADQAGCGVASSTLRRRWMGRPLRCKPCKMTRRSTSTEAVTKWRSESGNTRPRARARCRLSPSTPSFLVAGRTAVALPTRANCAWMRLTATAIKCPGRMLLTTLHGNQHQNSSC